MSNKQQQYDTLPLTPLAKHVDILCKSLAFGNLGHTPRPSNVERAYIAGFRDFNQANYDTADKSLIEAVSLARKEATRDPTGNNLELLGLSLGALGFLKALEEPTQALALYTEALGVWETVHGKDSPKLIFLFMDLSSIAKLANDIDQAIAFCQKARQVTEANSGPKSLDLQGILVNLATLKSEKGETQEATEVFTLAVNNLKELKHPSVSMALTIFLQHLQGAKDTERAEQVQKDLDQLKRKK